MFMHLVYFDKQNIGKRMSSSSSRGIDFIFIASCAAFAVVMSSSLLLAPSLGKKFNPASAGKAGRPPMCCTTDVGVRVCPPVRAIQP